MNKQLVFTASLLLACGSTFAYAGNVAGDSNASTDALIVAQNTEEDGATINGENAHERSQRIQQEAEKAEEKAGDKTKVTTEGSAEGDADADAKSGSGSAGAEAGASSK